MKGTKRKRDSEDIIPGSKRRLRSDTARERQTLLTNGALHSLPTSSQKSAARVSAWLGTRPTMPTRKTSSTSGKASKRNRRSSSPSNHSNPTSLATSVDSNSLAIYDAAQVLEDNMIYGPGKSAPPDNIEEIRRRLARPRASLSPSRDITKDYERFRRAHFNALNEEAITQEFSTSLRGRNEDYSVRNMVFARMAELTPVATRLSRPKPDFCVGEDPTNIPPQIRSDIGQYIVPAIGRSPAVVNDFAEIKGPDGREKHLMNQVAYDGAVGARAMHSMRAYGAASPPTDKNARSFVTAYAGGQASFYASYMGKPAGVGATPYYTYNVPSTARIMRAPSIGIGGFTIDWPSSSPRQTVRDACNTKRR